MPKYPHLFTKKKLLNMNTVVLPDLTSRLLQYTPKRPKLFHTFLKFSKRANNRKTRKARNTALPRRPPQNVDLTVWSE